jgi:hypothetical protein
MLITDVHQLTRSDSIFLFHKPLLGKYLVGISPYLNVLGDFRLTQAGTRAIFGLNDLDELKDSSMIGQTGKSRCLCLTEEMDSDLNPGHRSSGIKLERAQTAVLKVLHGVTVAGTDAMTLIT